MIYQLKKLAELQGKATEGPWTAFTDSYAPTRVLSHKNTICHVIGDSGETDDNAEYIAASRNFDLAALVAYVESLESRKAADERALKIAAAVDGDGFLTVSQCSTSEYCKGNNVVIERLRKIT